MSEVSPSGSGGELGAAEPSAPAPAPVPAVASQAPASQCAPPTPMPDASTADAAAPAAPAHAPTPTLSPTHPPTLRQGPSDASASSSAGAEIVRFHVDEEEEEEDDEDDESEEDELYPRAAATHAAGAMSLLDVRIVPAASERDPHASPEQRLVHALLRQAVLAHQPQAGVDGRPQWLAGSPQTQRQEAGAPGRPLAPTPMRAALSRQEAEEGGMQEQRPVDRQSAPLPSPSAPLIGNASASPSPSPSPSSSSPAPSVSLPSLHALGSSFDAPSLCAAVDALSVEQAVLLMRHMDECMREHIAQQMEEEKRRRKEKREKKQQRKRKRVEKKGAASHAYAPPPAAPRSLLPFSFPTFSNAHLTWRHLSYVHRDVLHLQRVSGFLECGGMVALLGASDAGATSLLQVLAQRHAGGPKSVHGEILINGLRMDQAPEGWRGVGYVSKDEVHLATLTVSETLHLSAHLRLPASLPLFFVQLRVELVIRLLGLGLVRHSPIGDALTRGISGGERRRVSVACELVASAPLLLWDLPTNGLDSASALSLLQVVKRVNGGNRGLMCSLVQPSMEQLALFDSIVLLSKGSIIYTGPLGGMEAYFRAAGFPRSPKISFPEWLEELSSDARHCWDKRTPLLQAYNDVGHAPTLRAWHMFDNSQQQQQQQQQQLPPASAMPKQLTHVEGSEDGARSMESAIEMVHPSLARSEGALQLARPALPHHVKRHATCAIGSGERRKEGTRTMWRVSPLLTRDPLCCALVCWIPHCLQIVSLNACWSHLVLSFDRSAFSDTLHQTLSHRLAPLPIPRRKLLEGPGAPVPPPPSFDVSAWGQLRLLLRRQVSLTWRSRSVIYANVLRNVFMGLVFGTLWWNVGTSQADARVRFGMFFSIANFQSMPVMDLVPMIIRQRNLFQMQRAGHYYGGWVYFATLLLINVPQAALECLGFLIPCYPLSNLRGGIFSGPFWYAFLSLFMVNINSRLWVFFLTSVARDEVVAQAIGPLTMVLLLNFCGYLVPTESIPWGWRWLHYADYMTYSFKGLVQNEMVGMRFHCDAESLSPPSSDPLLNLPPPDGFGGRQSCLLQTGNDVLSLYDSSSSDPLEHWNMLGVQVLFFVAFVLLAGGCMAYIRWHGADEPDAPRFRDRKAEKERRQSRLAMKHSHLESTPPRVVLTFQNLAYSVQVKAPKKARVVSNDPAEQQQQQQQQSRTKMVTRSLLRNTFGYAKPTQMVALMGPSGAGKSTLLDVLAGKKTGGSVSGSICVNGLPRDSRFERFAGYVDQVDAHNPRSTVRECVEFSARLRLPTSWTERAIQAKVANILDVLGLRHVENAVVGGMGVRGISPELRKKLSIAVELIMDPSLLFLDEPTTGLDAAGAQAVIEALKRLAQHISVVCTIHQPSAAIIQQFDLILLLKSPGEVAYFGPIQDISRYFSTSFPDTPPCAPGANLADYALDTLALLERRASAAVPSSAAAGDDGEEEYEDGAEGEGYEYGSKSSMDIAAVFARSSIAQDAWREIQALEQGGKGAGLGGTGVDATGAKDTDLRTTIDVHPPKVQLDSPAHPTSSSSALSLSPPPLQPHAVADMDVDVAADEPKVVHASFQRQVRSLVYRFFFNTLRDRAGLYARASAPIFYALFLGTQYWRLGDGERDVHARMPLMYTLTVEAAFSCAILFPALFEARLIYFREIGARTYTPASYYVARTLADLPFSVSESLLFCLLVYFPAGLTLADSGRPFALFLLCYFLNRNIGLAFAEVCASVAPLAESANGLLATTHNFMQLFSGFLIRAPSIPRAWMWVHWLTFFRYSIYFLQANELRHIDHVECGADGRRLPVATSPLVDCSVEGAQLSLYCSRPVCLVSSGPQQLEEYDIGYAPSDLALYLWVLCIFLVAYRTFAFLALKHVRHLTR